VNPKSDTLFYMMCKLISQVGSYLLNELLQKKSILVTAVHVQTALLWTGVAAMECLGAQHHSHYWPELQLYRVVRDCLHHPCMHDLHAC
jgi:hypothetical protein